MFAINTINNIMQQGLCYALVALGVYISYKVLDFPDLTVDGSFPLGAVVTVMLVNSGMNFIIATLLAILAGALAGFVTGMFHVKFKITNLLSGILTMTGLLSITLVLGNNKVVVPYSNATLFKNNLISSINPTFKVYVVIAILLVIVIAFKFLLDIFLKTKCGFMLRAVGANEQLCTSLGENCGKYKILGLVIANGLVGFAGSVYSQMIQRFDNGSGVGMVVIALASVIIGCTLFSKMPKVKGTTAVIVGAIVYTAILNIIIALGLPSTYLRLLMAVIFACVLVINNKMNEGKFNKKKEKNNA